MTQQDTQFAQYAGQLITAGAWTDPAPAPAIALEGVSDPTVLANLQRLHGLMQKVAEVVIHEPAVFESPLESMIRKYGTPYGVGIEQMGFLTGAPNKRNDGRCIAHGDVDGASQINLINFAHNIELSIYDREVNRAVLNEQQAGSYIGAKMRLPLKTMAQMKYRSTVQLLSDIVDGTRSVVGYQNSNEPDSAQQTYSVTVAGYAGDVEAMDAVVPAVTEGDLVSFADPSDATDIIKTLQGVARDFKFESDSYNKLGIQTFVSGRPTVIMEAKTLDAMDNVLALDGTDKRIPTRDAREYIRTFADIREIDAFAALPTNSSYTNQRIMAVMCDADDFLFEGIQENSVEGQRCSNQRSVGYSYRYASTLGIWKGSNSYAMTVKTA